MENDEEQESKELLEKEVGIVKRSNEIEKERKVWKGVEVGRRRKK